MKRLLYCLPLLLCQAAISQNVGVGETSPTHKLTVRTTDPFSRSLLLKTTTNDTAMVTLGFNHFLNGYTNASSATMTVGNKHFLPFDNPQLSVMAWGEKSGINAAGSFGTLDFRNINNSNTWYNFSAYTGNAAAHTFGLFYTDIGAGVSKSLLHFTQAGNTGIGTFSPVGRLQINHTSSIANPTLNLYDSTTSGGPIIQFRNAGGSKTWQLRTNLNHVAPNSDEMEFVNNNSVMASLGNNGNLAVTGTVSASEVHRPSTGTSNLVPIAYGNITTGGLINSGSGNFTVSKISTGWYSITITGESYQFQIYTTVVTPAGNVGPIMTNTGSGGGNLHVYTYNSAGAAADSQFCFVVYKQ
jgi:hypothetical protein